MIKKNKHLFLNKLAEFKKKKILVIGDIMLDEYLWGSVDRISPEAPVPVVLVNRETRVPGGATNVVNNLLGLGAKVFICGVIGHDMQGKYLINFFKKKNVDVSGIFISDLKPTSLKTRIIAHNQQVVRVDKEDSEPIDNKCVKKILQYVKKNITAIDGIIISDYGKGVILPELIENIIRIANKHNKIITVDPKIEHFFQYKNVTLITPNHHEAEKAMNIRIKNQLDIERIGRLIIKKLHLKSLFITQSKDGMTVFQKGCRPQNIPTHAVKVYDVTGAGDTVISTATMSLVSGFDYKQAAGLSNYAAGIVVGEVGTTIITLDKLERALQNE